MKFFVMIGVFVTLCLGVISVAIPQSKTPTNQQAGDCSVNITGSDNTASLVCTGVNSKLAEQVRAILNRTRRNENAVKDMSEKLDRILEQMDKENTAPVVGLRFVYPKSPALVLVNQSDGIARDIKYIILLWNMDIPDRNDPLPIPTGSFDWITPHDEAGPEGLFNDPSVAQLLKPGNRLFGSAAINCPKCARGRTYVVYIVWGEGGWVSEIENEQPGRAIAPPSFLKESRYEYFKALEAVISAQSRKPIAGLQGVP
jgi:hypothetical protein